MVQSVRDGAAAGVGSARVNGMLGVLSAFFPLCTVPNEIMVTRFGMGWEGVVLVRFGLVGLVWPG